MSGPKRGFPRFFFWGGSGFLETGLFCFVDDGTGLSASIAMEP